ncbi:hypothetical protein PCASD_07385 [Puccinia coronata f. sp. avenae]|uniref:Protein CPL1-like domain-containing protein n=1 Tax=Puccinia coronata f. sp. avenae TaxID=200324 RepID=A0A2N5V989_9BASI|nr:hypothetical protein PCASD_07385 [Puccinia coronata f. sp. avenae]
MLAIQTLSLVAFLSSISAYDVPVVTPPSSTQHQLSSRQLLTAGSSLTSQVGVTTGLASASCGLDTNVWGQVSSVSSSGYANLCLQCRVNVLGVQILAFNFYSALVASIGAHGVSASQVAVLQSSIDNDLLTLSAGQKTSARCTAACLADQRCQSSSFATGSCKLQAVNYATQNKAGVPLAQALQSLYTSGGSGYCAVCPSDRSCTGAATASGLARRSSTSNVSEDSKCPAGLSACPVSSAGYSTGFECLDVQQEVTSCGGCSSTGQGVDCTAIKGASSTGCAQGKCTIFSCKPGYQYYSFLNICHKSHRVTKARF